MDIKITGEPIFLVLPSLIIENIICNERTNYIILDPSLGRYIISTRGTITRKYVQLNMDSNIRIKNKLYCILVPNYGTTQIIDIQDDNIIAELLSVDDPISTYHRSIKHPMMLFRDKKYMFILDHHLQLIKIDKSLDQNLHIIMDKKIILWDSWRICDSGDGESYFRTEYKKLMRHYYDKSLLIDYRLEIPHCYSWPITLNNNYVFYISDQGNTIINVKTQQIFSSPTSIENCSTNIIYESLFHSNIKGITKVIYLNRLQNLKTDFDFDDISTTLLEITNYDRYISIYKINENPFKTPERDRLAQYLYEQFQKILPFGIAGIITDYCTLVKYCDYEVLMNWINS